MTDEIANVARSVVAIQGNNGNTGSGTVIRHGARNSWVLTCAHVVEDADEVAVVGRYSDFLFTKPVAGRVERTLPGKDLALIRLKKRIAVPALAIAAKEPDLYEQVIGVGAPGGLFGTAFLGLLSGRDGSNGDRDAGYQFTGLVCPGSSGGAVANYEGELIGVISSMKHNGHLPVWGIGFAVALPDVRAFLKEPRK